MADDFKYHIDHHASLLTPPEIVEARAAGTDVDLRAAEDTAVSRTLLTQRRLGLAASSDGEYRRRNHLSVVYDGIAGFGPAGAAAGPLARLVDERHAPEVRALVEPPAERGRLVKHETDFVLSAVRRPVLVALPSPGYVAELAAEAGGADPAASADAGERLARILRDEIAAAAADGVRYVLLTNPAYGFLLAERGRARAAELGLDPDAAIERMLAADAQVLAGLETPAEFRVGLDITTAGTAGGPYDAAAVAGFLGRSPFGRLCVEFPRDAAARFPLGELPSGLVISLGIVDVSDPALENVDELVGRIDAAAEVVDIDDIAISTNGGFRSVPGGLDEATQRDKLQRVEMVARYFWGNEL
ncbi:methionine synthase [Pseudofrankia sp. BMG5.36]|uniref:methionine synthase n=1 Tax=Pseudofrankia sp. BMG5.36 TaxID=1834512 RepID=UPI0008DB0C41|nr:methionine synthase [Pseudofrankia sp. BMG5.36]OHV64344.1 methionine synthase [Pseudofrankia sp. BMG5.36]